MKDRRTDRRKATRRLGGDNFIGVALGIERRTRKKDRRKGATVKAKTYHGVYYFPTYYAARNFACRFAFPTNRIIEYGRGWAIQLRESGPYVGPQEHDLAILCASD